MGWTTLSSRLQHLSSGYEPAAGGPSVPGGPSTPLVPAAHPGAGERFPAEPPGAGTARARPPRRLSRSFKGNRVFANRATKKHLNYRCSLFFPAHQKASKEQPVASERRSRAVVVSVPPAFRWWAALMKSLLGG